MGFAALLFLFAGLLNWGATFAEENVASQLEMQNIAFPAEDGLTRCNKDSAS